MIDPNFRNMDVRREIKPGEALSGDQFEGFTYIKPAEKAQ